MKNILYILQATAEAAAALHGPTGQGHRHAATNLARAATAGGRGRQDPEGAAAGRVHQGAGQLPEHPAGGRGQGEAEAGGRAPGPGGDAAGARGGVRGPQPHPAHDRGGGQTQGAGGQGARHAAARVRYYRCQHYFQGRNTINIYVRASRFT